MGRSVRIAKAAHKPPLAGPEGRQNVGLLVFAVAAVALGVLGLVTGDFAGVWQPVPPEMPHRAVAAYAAAAVFLFAGAALLNRRSLKLGAGVLILLYTVFTLLWAMKVARTPTALGAWSGMAEQLVLVLAASLLWIAPDPRAAPSKAFVICRGLFGLCLLSFGLIHFDALKQTAALVPTWLPPSQPFWAKATGVAHIAAGMALLTGTQARLAMRLLTAMFISFGLIIWLPKILGGAAGHFLWAANLINLALIGAAWVLADRIGRASGQAPLAA